MNRNRKSTELAEARQQIVESMTELADYVREQAQGAPAAHEVERAIWKRVLQMGWWALNYFFSCAGDGDLGAEIDLPDGRRVRRLPERHVRHYRSVFGELPVERAVYGSREGQRIEHVPLDAQLQLPEGKFSYLLQDWDQSLVVEEPYAGVSKWLSRILGFSQSVDSLERMNRKAAALVPEFFDALPTPAPEEEGEIVIASADGKGVPMRRRRDEAPIDGHRPKRGPKPNTKKMALLGTVYTVDPLRRTPEEVVASLFREPHEAAPEVRPGRPNPQHKRVRASLARSDTGTTEPASEEIFGWMAREVDARNPCGTKPLCLLMDGLESQWRAARQTLPGEQVTEILDLLHVTPRIWAAAHLFHEEGSPAALAFVKDRLLRILQGKITSVTAALRWMADYRNLPPGKRKKLGKICDFLDKNCARMRYDMYLEAGYPIATGVIEGACRHLVKDRLERAGMRWILDGAQSMLHMRSVHLSGLWNEFTAYRIERENQRLYPHASGPEGHWLANAA